MNIKKLALLSMVTFSVATVHPEFACEAPIQTAAQTETKQYWNAYIRRDDADKYAKYILTTIIPGVGVGLLTGQGIGYMSGTLFDALVSPLGGAYAPVTALARLAAQVGSKLYWEKPLRHKLLSWIQGDIKKMYSYATGTIDGSDEIIIDESLCNEECSKTLARVCAWLGLVSQVRV